MIFSRTLKHRPVVLVDEAPFQVEESYNSLRTNIRFLSADKKIKKFVVTSSGPLDGKTTVSANLGISMGKAGHRVLLIDSDLRKPRINKIFRVKASPGLTNILIEGQDPEKVIIRLKERGIDLITSGPIPPNPSELLGSERMKNLLEQLGKEYDYTILDTPPAALITDAAVLSHYADGVIVVVAYKRSTREIVDNAVNNLKTAGANIMGMVLTDVEYSGKGRGYSFNKYGYYKHRDYSKYADKPSNTQDKNDINGGIGFT